MKFQQLLDAEPSFQRSRRTNHPEPATFRFRRWGEDDPFPEADDFRVKIAYVQHPNAMPASERLSRLTNTTKGFGMDATVTSDVRGKIEFCPAFGTLDKTQGEVDFSYAISSRLALYDRHLAVGENLSPA